MPNQTNIISFTGSKLISMRNLLGISRHNIVSTGSDGARKFSEFCKIFSVHEERIKKFLKTFTDSIMWYFKVICLIFYLDFLYSI